MNILPHNEHDGQMLYTVIEKFFAMFRVGDLLHKCNAGNEKGVPVMKVFRYLTNNVFNHRSMYMQLKTKSFE